MPCIYVAAAAAAVVVVKMFFSQTILKLNYFLLDLGLLLYMFPLRVCYSFEQVKLTNNVFAYEPKKSHLLFDNKYFLRLEKKSHVLKKCQHTLLLS